MSKKIFLIIIIVGLLIAGVYQIFLRNKDGEFVLAEVIRGNIVQEVFETGQIRKGEKINLSFKNAGRIEKVYVLAEEEVEKGDVLAMMDNSQLIIQIEEAKAALSLAQAQLDKILAGATAEEIEIARTETGNRQIALIAAEQELKNAYQGSLDVLNEVYLKASNAYNVAAEIQRTYFTLSDQQGIKVKENKGIIERAVSEIEFYLNHEDIDIALAQVKNNLSFISDSLKIIRDICEEPFYRTAVSAADKTSLDTQRTSINAAIASVTASQQSIVSAKMYIESVAGNFQAAQDNLNLITAPARQEDVEYYQAQVRRARAQVSILENQLQDSYLKAPVKGQIIEIKKKQGELVQPALQDTVMIMLPFVPYEIKADIYEENVVKVSVGNPVEISLVALPGQVFKGNITSISPAEKIIDGVVYYELTVNFEKAPQNIRPSMTADLVIRADSKDDVLMVHRDAVQRREGRTIVEVFKDETTEEREVQIGIRGTDNMVEIISGELKEGEKIILR